MIKVLVVDDSPTARTLFGHILQSANNLQLVAMAKSGKEAIRMVGRHKPDVILMDAMMPDMDGLEATRQIMEKSPTPIVIISSAANDREANLAFHAIRAGALTVLNKPNGPGHPDFDKQARKIQRTLNSMASVHVIHHRKNTPKPAQPLHDVDRNQAHPHIVGVVSSTGGPGVLSKMLENLPTDFPLPIVIVQHISTDFIHSLVKWLNSVSTIPVMQARQSQIIEPGKVYIAPNKLHLRVTPARRFDLSAEPKKLFTPSGDVLLASIADVYKDRAIGIILTGMGNDGVEGLAQLYAQNAMTIAQDQTSAVVFGMPKAALERGIVRQTLPPLAIVNYLRSVAKPVTQ